MFFRILGIGLMLTSYPVLSGAAQREDAGYLSVNLALSESTLTTLPTGLRHMRVFDERDELVFDVNVANMSAQPVRLDVTGLYAGVSAMLRDGLDRSRLVAHWSGEGLLGTDQITLGDTGSIVMEGGAVLVTRVGFERDHAQPFGVGRYAVDVSFLFAREALGLVDGSPWKGRLPVGTTSFEVTISLPATSAERATMHRLRAEAAERRGDYSAAIDSQLRALEALPDDPALSGTLAIQYLAARRYDEAILTLERIARRQGPSRDWAVLTARAYVGRGDEASARRALRQGGVPDAEIDNQIQDARSRLRRP